jgi:hypothetical protein
MVGRCLTDRPTQGSMEAGGADELPLEASDRIRRLTPTSVSSSNGSVDGSSLHTTGDRVVCRLDPLQPPPTVARVTGAEPVNRVLQRTRVPGISSSAPSAEDRSDHGEYHENAHEPDPGIVWFMVGLLFAVVGHCLGSPRCRALRCTRP